MRRILFACVLVLTGCVSQSQPGLLSDDFDTEQAAKTRISLGLTYLKNGKYSQAKENLDTAIDFAPRLADAHYAMAYYYQQVEEDSRAREYYASALDLAPANADIANSYGAYLCEQGDFDTAFDYFDQAVSNQRYANTVLTYENMGLCAQKQGNHNQAIDYFRSALNHQPSRTRTMLLLTEEYIATGNWDEAQKRLDRYRRMGRVTPESIWLAVRIADGQNDLESRQQYGEMLRTLYPDSAQAKAYEKQFGALPDITRTTKDSPFGQSHQLTAMRADSNRSQSTQHDEKRRQTAENSRFHIVQKNENLYRISVKYNIKLSSLVAWNPHVDTSSLEVDDQLWLVPPEQR